MWRVSVWGFDFDFEKYGFWHLWICYYGPNNFHVHFVWIQTPEIAFFEKKGQICLFTPILCINFEIWKSRIKYTFWKLNFSTIIFLFFVDFIRDPHIGVLSLWNFGAIGARNSTQPIWNNKTHVVFFLPFSVSAQNNLCTLSFFLKLVPSACPSFLVRNGNLILSTLPQSLDFPRTPFWSILARTTSFFRLSLLIFVLPLEALSSSLRHGFFRALGSFLLCMQGGSQRTPFSLWKM